MPCGGARLTAALKGLSLTIASGGTVPSSSHAVSVSRTNHHDWHQSRKLGYPVITLPSWAAMIVLA